MIADVVVPTTGRPSLGALLERLEGQPISGSVIVVDDRPGAVEPLPFDAGDGPRRRLRVLRSHGRGPAAARNVGWRASGAEWIAFLDDDVLPPPDWWWNLVADLEPLPDEVGASQGRVRVPLPRHRRPTDWERTVKGLEAARWATADMAYRRRVLERLDGFSERFARAYREDADLGLRTLAAGFEIVRGRRWVEHPAGRPRRWVSLAAQAGNADDALMEALHGRGWRHAAGAPAGRRRLHLLTTASGLAALLMLLAGRRRLGAAAGLGWAALTGQLAWSRIAPGPRTREEGLTMALTSVVIPPLATWHWAQGRLASRHIGPRRPRAVLFDRDGTLIEDVPYNGDPRRVRPRPGARRALDRLRKAGLPVAVVSNQSGLARGRLTWEQVAAVNARVEELLGPFAAWAVCPHHPDEGCGCRKPAPGMIRETARRLGLSPRRCAVVGDIGADVTAAAAAGARGVLVPTPRTRPEEVREAPELAPDLEAAVDRLLGARP